MVVTISIILFCTVVVSFTFHYRATFLVVYTYVIFIFVVLLFF